MGVRLGLLLLLVLGIRWINVDARNLVASDLLAKQVKYKGPKSDTGASQADDQVCTFCEQYASQAINYLSNNKTQTEILDTLHLGCSNTHSFKKECTALVDYYAPLFFIEITKLEPGELCSKMNLCEMAFASEDSCTVCHEAVAEALTKLQDPDTQLEIIQILLKACEKTDQYVKRCKRLVFEYGPIIMANAEKYLANNDLCIAIRACKTSTDGSEVASASFASSLISES